jgi:hypothetical protein
VRCARARAAATRRAGARAPAAAGGGFDASPLPGRCLRARCSYLFHQKEMLEDQQRMQAYHDAVFNNKACFEGKARSRRHAARAPRGAFGAR